MNVTTNCTLKCGCHRILTGPNRRIGELVYCTTHKKAVTIVSNLPEYHVRCRICKYSRKWGQAKLTALTKASSHAVRLRHTVDVYHGNKLEETVGQQHQGTLPGLNDPVIRGGPPRLRKLHEGA
jgi:hypothetical protein